jgi:hypothetical protein
MTPPKSGSEWLYERAFIYIVTYPGVARLIKRVLYLMIEFIGPLYNCLQQFTNHYLTHCHLLPTGHSTGAIPNSSNTPLHSVVLPPFRSPILFCIIYNSSARTHWKTWSSVVKNVLIDPLPSNGCPSIFDSVCLAMGICVTIYRVLVQQTRGERGKLHTLVTVKEQWGQWTSKYFHAIKWL